MKENSINAAATTEATKVVDTPDASQSVQNVQSAALDSLDTKYNNNFSDEIFPKLPSFMQEYDSITLNRNQRDLAFLTELGILSACLPEVFCFIDGSKSYPNLFLLLYAPPASDKGKVSVLMRIADELEKQISGGENLNYDLTNLSDADRRTASTPKGFFLDGDSSLIAMVEAISKGKENLLFDSEAVILSQSRKNDWSQLDPILRKSFHFERISLSRKDRAIRITEPRISLVISGTNNDARELAGSIQGGLVSRILPYTFTSPLKWRSQFSSEASNIPAFIAHKSKQLLDIYNFNKAFPFEFKLTDSQIKLHDKTFGDWTDQLEKIEEFGSLKRLGVASVRIAMILTSLRRVEMDNKESVIYCDEDIFEIALSIAGTFNQQIDYFYDLLGYEQIVSLKGIQKVLNSLPDEFTTDTFIKVCEKTIELKIDGAKKQLKKLIEKKVLDNYKHGHYRKIS